MLLTWFELLEQKESDPSTGEELHPLLILYSFTSNSMRSSLSSYYASVDEYVQTTIKRLEQQDPSLQKLLVDDFHYPAVDLDGDQYFDSLTIAKLLLKAKESPHVKDLEMRFVELDGTITEALKQLLSGNPRDWQNISVIGCSGCHGAFLTPLSMALEQCNRLIMNHNNLDYEGFQRLGQSLRTSRTLQSLHFKRDSLTGANATVLFEGLQVNNTLEELVLNFCRFDQQGIDALSMSLQRNTFIKTLDLGGCYLSDQFVEQIVSSLANHPSLESLVLTLNSCHERGTQAIARLLSSDSCRLMHLNLSHQKDEEDRKPCIESLAKAIQKNTSLSSLKLSRNSLRSHEIPPLIHAMTLNSTLQYLDLTNNLIDDDGWKEIAAALPKMRGLSSLHLLNNDMNDEASIGEALLAGISENHVLTDLEIKESLPSYQRIQYHVALNWGGRQLLSATVHTPLGLWSRILERAHLEDNKAGFEAFKHDIVFHMLKGPVLLFT